jgi:DNA-binding GntR family transcriptional regulator
MEIARDDLHRPVADGGHTVRWGRGHMINRNMLREQVKEEMINRILSGYWQPGDRIIESQLAKELGLSQSPVREALRDLVAMRFVEIEPYKGARVRNLSRSELAEIYPVRAALEELAGQLAASRFGADLGRLEAIYAEMLAAGEQNDVQRLVALDADFHRLIVETAGNGILRETWSSLMIEQRTLVTAVAVAMSEHGLKRVAEMHAPILDAIRHGDGIRAGRELRHHAETFERVVRQAKANGTDPD